MCESGQWTAAGRREPGLVGGRGREVALEHKCNNDKVVASSEGAALWPPLSQGKLVFTQLMPHSK